jgi:LAO/AO transport system kinase
MKRGILELADVIGVNKADGDSKDAAEQTAQDLAAALRLLPGADGGWQTPVVTCSALTADGLANVWREVQRHRAWLQESGRLQQKRRRQLVHWTRALVRDRLLARLEIPEVRALAERLEGDVLAERMTPDQAADRLLQALEASS